MPASIRRHGLTLLLLFLQVKIMQLGLGRKARRYLRAQLATCVASCPGTLMTINIILNLQGYFIPKPLDVFC